MGDRAGVESDHAGGVGRKIGNRHAGHERARGVMTGGAIPIQGAVLRTIPVAWRIDMLVGVVTHVLLRGPSGFMLAIFRHRCVSPLQRQDDQDEEGSEAVHEGQV